MRSFTLVALLLPALASGYKPATAPKHRASSFGNAEYLLSPVAPVPVAEGAVTISTVNGIQAPALGYLPLWLQCKNNTPQARKFVVQVVGNNGGGTFAREVELSGNETRRVTLPVPANIGGAQLEVSGAGIKSESSHVYFSSYLNTSILALGSEEDFRAFAGKGPSTTSPDMAVLTMSPDDLPDELSAIIGFSAVVLLDRAMETLNDGERRMLEQYAATGGLLVIAKPSRNMQAYLPLWDGHDASLGEDYGFGRLVLCDDEQSACGSQTLELAYTQGFAVNPVAPTPAYMRPFGGRYYSAESADALLKQAAPPVGRFLVIMLLFAALIGPGSLFVARRKGPLFVLITIPGVALITCLGIAGYSAVVDGFAVHTTTRGYTLLDRKSARGVTVGVEAFYANLTPDGPQYSSSTALIFPTERYNTQAASITWNGGAKFGGDFIPSRTYREWGVMAVEPTRARLVVKAGEAPRVLNALGGTVRVGFVRWNDALWRFEDVAEGAEGALTKHSAKGNPVADALGEPGEKSRFTANVDAAMRAPLAEGWFVAELSGSGMMPLGGLRTQHEGDVHVVRGEVE